MGTASDEYGSNTVLGGGTNFPFPIATIVEVVVEVFVNRAVVNGPPQFDI